MKALNVTALPLSGTHLIEASAGTGKTFTLAHLYLRLIVERCLSVDQILVVTFTRAAVQELRTRLRQIIVEARAVLAEPDEHSGLVVDILQPHLQDETLTDRLEAAQLSMDEASISTIHTFCMQLLSDNAFESGQLFDMQVEDRDNALQLQAVQAYWREHYVDAVQDEDVISWVDKTLGSPATLLHKVKPLLSANPPSLLPAGDKAQYTESAASIKERWAIFSRMWRESGIDIRALIDESPDLNRGKIRAATVAKAADHLDKLCASAAVPNGFDDSLKVFRDSHLSTSAKKGKNAPVHDFFILVDGLWDVLGGLAALRLSAELQHCAAYVQQWLHDSKLKLRMMSYEDLLINASDALSGEGAEALAERLRQTFPAALIDEFQDTDPRQYGIFSTIYGDQEDCAWYMIGDPKQAIYSFRGADINTYLDAAAATENQHTLAVNYRSTSAMIETVNALFENKPSPFAIHSGVNSAVDFYPVEASGKTESKCLSVGGEPQPALRLAILSNEETDKPLTKSAASLDAAQMTAALIAEQLISENTIDGKPLEPSHIAVLVRSHHHGKMIHAALAAQGIASVVTGKDSIFSTPEALTLKRLLHALHDPRDERAILRVLASDLCDFSPEQLLHLQSVDADWQTHVDTVMRLARLLPWRGILAVILELMTAYRSAATLQKRIGGERTLSNYLQLGELLQEQWQERPDLSHLQAWLEQMSEQPDAGDVSQLRLETDQKLVQIVTVHKSKGLEYPVIYLPFVWAARKPNPKEGAKCLSKVGRCIDLGSEQFDEHVELMEAEELSEEMRLLYVALTRASAQVNLIWGDVKDANHTALASLLGQMGEKVDLGFAETCKAWVQDCEHAALVEVPDTVTLAASNESPVLVAKPFNNPPKPSWQVSSYSGLVRRAWGHPEMPDHDGSADVPAPSEPPEFDEGSIMFFPRGAQAGTFLHYIFEYADFCAGDSPETAKLVEDALAMHGYKDTWQAAVMGMVQQVLDAPLLPVADLRLSDVSHENRLNEMGFHFPVPALDCAALLQVLRDFGVMGPNEHLDFDTVNGYMTGFVDLIFRSGEQYFVLDYKSNHLGYRSEDYHPQALKSAMQHHRYDLQYLIYTVALHRYLATRIPNYSYENHMGGSFYLFLRGMRVDDPKAPGVFFDKPDFALIEALDQLFGVQAEASA